MGRSAIILAAISLLLEICVLTAMGKRHLLRAFPFFSAYISSTVVIELVRVSVIRDYATYFNVFWGSEVLYAVLSILALYEAFNRLFKPFLQSYPWFRFVFPVTAVVFAAVPLVYTLSHPPKQASPLISLIVSLELGVNILQCGLFAVFLLIKQILKIRSRIYAWGIVEGFAAVALAGFMYAARSEFGTRFNFLVKYGPPLAYILALIFWLDTFTRSGPDPTWRLAITPEELLEEVNTYTRALRRLLERRR